MPRRDEEERFAQLPIPSSDAGRERDDAMALAPLPLLARSDSPAEVVPATECPGCGWYARQVPTCPICATALGVADTVPDP